MHDNYIKIIKNDVKVATNGKCVDISVAPYDQKGASAQVSTITVERATAVRLCESLDAYLTMDRTK